eukprot:TRINITY_DN5772_c0_g1_i3.p1 TRINITY_DN5772_c0_g1~~TRINITY_DN5772_c0_g1_i3.p1  ORF type:complete len:188 (-),score=70.11 TRINITY_DN5772_c0_g1_i3:47-610(-)
MKEKHYEDTSEEEISTSEEETSDEETSIEDVSEEESSVEEEKEEESIKVSSGEISEDEVVGNAGEDAANNIEENAAPSDSDDEFDPDYETEEETIGKRGDDEDEENYNLCWCERKRDEPIQPCYWYGNGCCLSDQHEQCWDALVDQFEFEEHGTFRKCGEQLCVTFCGCSELFCASTYGKIYIYMCK